MLFVAFCLGEPSFGCLCFVAFVFVWGNPLLAVYVLLILFGRTLFWLSMCCFSCFSTNLRLGVRGGFEVRFHEGSTRVPPGSARAAGWCRMLLGMSPELIVFV